MNDRIEARLRNDLHAVETASLPAVDEVAHDVTLVLRRRGGRRRAATASAAVLLVVAAGLGVWRSGRDRSTTADSIDTSTAAAVTSVTAAEPASTMPTTAVAIDPVAGSWAPVPPDPRGPVRDAQVVWTGTEAISLGGADQAGGAIDTVAAYNPSIGVWRRVTTTATPVMVPLAVWTGADVLAVGWRDGEGNSAAVSLNPVSGVWTLGAQMPFGFKSTPDTPHVWTGSELLLFADRPVAYNPATDSWRLLAAAPIAARYEATSVWTGSEWIMWGGAAVADSSTLGDGAAYNPATDTWRLLPPAPLSERIVSGVWAGTELLITAGRSGDENGMFAFADGAAYDPTTDTWRSLADGFAHPGFAPIWTGQRLILFAKGGAVGYNRATDRWSDYFPGTSGVSHDDAAPIWTGSVVVLLGSYDASTGGAVFTPPT